MPGFITSGLGTGGPITALGEIGGGAPGTTPLAPASSIGVPVGLLTGGLGLGTPLALGGLATLATTSLLSGTFGLVTCGLGFGTALPLGGLGSSFVVVATDLVESLAHLLTNDSAMINLIPGGFWADSAPDEVVFPYGVVLEIGESAGYSSQDNSGAHPFIDDGQIQISIFVEGGKAAARSVGQQVEDVLNDVTLAFAGGYLMNLRRVHRTSMLDPAKGPNQGDVWQRILTFATSVGRTL